MILTGLDAFLLEAGRTLGQRRVGLVSHPAAVSRGEMLPCLDALQKAGVKVTALYGPEHGFSGAAADGAAVGHTRDRRSGLPVYSLYGATLEPTPEMLAGVDLLIFDMQDVGVRFYTYLSTLYYVLRGAAKAGKPVLLLDRPNPINAVQVEGPGIAPGFYSFVGIASMPVRHGLTLGELARWLNAGGLAGVAPANAELEVVSMSGWRREMWFDDTGLCWAPTSPAMAHLSTATLYPGMCLLEGTNFSEGRGTSLPFEICGAPGCDGYALAKQMNSLDLPGVRFRPVEFVPAASKFAGKTCSGVQVHVTGRNVLQPVALGLHLVAALRRAFPEQFAWREAHFDRLTGSDQVRLALERGESVEDITATWESVCAEFRRRRTACFLYETDWR
jgi:uncharacterized protein YbbC (DUF1343 family)